MQQDICSKGHLDGQLTKKVWTGTKTIFTWEHRLLLHASQGCSSQIVHPECFSCHPLTYVFENFGHFLLKILMCFSGTDQNCLIHRLLEVICPSGGNKENYGHFLLKTSICFFEVCREEVFHRLLDLICPGGSRNGLVLGSLQVRWKTCTGMRWLNI